MATISVASRSKSTLASVLSKAALGLRFNQHIEAEGPTVFLTPVRWGWRASCRSRRLALS